MTSSVSPFVVNASELSPIFIPGNSHMGPDNLPILGTMRVKILLVLQLWAHAEVNSSRWIQDCFQKIPLLCFYLWEKERHQGLGGLQWAAAC